MDRPALNLDLSEAELQRWYWTMAELQPFARSLAIAAHGPKSALIERIGARLSGREVPAEDKRALLKDGLTGSLSLDSPIPPGQRSTQELRSFFEEAIGPSFKFNGHMRAFLKAGEATLGDAIDHWHSTVGTPLPQQSESLEFNRFTAAWHRAHPDGATKACREAWHRFRALPIDERPSLDEL